MGLRIHTSNRLEQLAGVMARGLLAPPVVVGKPLPPNPARAEVLVLNSRGMEAWLQQELARQSPAGICANLRVVLPNSLPEFILRHQDGGRHNWAEVLERPLNDFSRDLLVWRVHGRLGEVRPGSAVGDPWAPVAAYLFDDPQSAGGGPEEAGVASRRWQLARQVAELFDQYQMYRPALLADWESGGMQDLTADDRWQAELWRALRAGSTHWPRGAALAQWCATPRGTWDLPVFTLPRVWVFGLSTLPPIYFEVLRTLGATREVHLLLRTPTPARRLQRPPEKPAEMEPLGDGLGGQMHGLLALLCQDAQARADLADHSHDQAPVMRPRPLTLLSAVQQQIYLGQPQTLPDDLARQVLAGGDASLRLHACHGPLREVEVLHEYLLEWLAGDPQRLPGRILVMAPDIEQYVSAIEAVFNRPERQAPDYIPYAIADRQLSRTSAVLRAVFQLLGLPGQRCRYSEVLELLETPALAAAYGLTDSDLPRLREWLQAARIRWGLDATQRQELGFPALGASYSWQKGLDRLFAGYALAEGAEDSTAPLLNDALAALPNVEGSETRLLGSLASLLTRLRALRLELARPRPAAAWVSDLSAWLARDFKVDQDSAAELALLRRALSDFGTHADAARMAEPLPIAVVASFLQARCDQSGGAGPFCRGQVTFCSLLPMRSVPADFIWLLGMNGDSFPRQDPRAAWNLLARTPQATDRSRRLDDRYLFLEVLLSAGERLHLSYQGRSPRDNAALPPSVLVRELTRESRAMAGAGALPDAAFHQALTITHPLLGFDPRYFQEAGADSAVADSAVRPDPRLFSYSKSGLELAQLWRLAASQRRESRFFEGPTGEPIVLPMPPPESPLWRPTLAQVTRFFSESCQELLQRRLEINLRDQNQLIEDDEPCSQDYLEGYQLQQALVDHRLAQMPPGGRILTAPAPTPDADPTPEPAPAAPASEALLARWRAEDAVPPGAQGAWWLATKDQEVAHWLAQPVPDAGLTVAELLRDARALNYRVPLAQLGLASFVLPPPPGAPPGTPVTTLTLDGHLTLYGSRQAFGRFAKLKAKDRLEALLAHLVAVVAGEPCTTYLLGTESRRPVVIVTLVTPPGPGVIERARDDLDALLRLYQCGLLHPLPWVATASWDYAETLLKEDPDGLDDEALSKARDKADNAWLGTDFNAAHDGVQKAANRYCLGEASLCDRAARGELALLPGNSVGVERVRLRFEDLALLVYQIYQSWLEPTPKSPRGKAQ